MSEDRELRSARWRRTFLTAALACCLGLGVAGAAEAQPRVIKYEVAREGATRADFREFAYTVDAILNDPRGWSLSGAVEFRRVSRGGLFAVTLASPSAVARHGCNGSYSCRLGHDVLINDHRWRRATPSYRGAPVHAYRQMVVNHEVGHALGFGHARCRRAGAFAPVMQQQSGGLQGCRRNGFALARERRTLARRLGIRLLPVPSGIGIGRRIGPVELQGSLEQVLGRLGTPSSREARGGASSLLRYRVGHLDVLVVHERVAGVSTRSSTFRTRAGVGVGSTRGQAVERLDGAACDPTACLIHDPAGGAATDTTFLFGDGRVTEVRLGPGS